MTIDELVKNLTKVHPLPKSQVRRMILEYGESLVQEERKMITANLKDFRDENGSHVIGIERLITFLDNLHKK
jgi:hypothetical protein